MVTEHHSLSPSLQESGHMHMFMSLALLAHPLDHGGHEWRPLWLYSGMGLCPALATVDSL